jgi:hypothetical protein
VLELQLENSLEKFEVTAKAVPMVTIEIEELVSMLVDWTVETMATQKGGNLDK